MPKHVIEILEWLPYERNTLLGFAKIRIKELRLVISGVAIHQKNGSRWAQLPCKPMFKDGELIHEPDGRIKYAKILELETSEVQQAFSAAVLDAYDIYLPP
jgi:hypothetical protein